MIISQKLRDSAGKRFAGKYEIDGETGCWIWTASVNQKRGGYGRFRLGSNTTSAHKASWMIHRGDIPIGLHVLHRCDTPACVNPDHLFLGTNAENVADMDAKNRRVNGPSIGAANGRAKLTDDEVLEIFRGSDLQDEAAKRYGVSRSVISLIRLGKRWTHITGGRP